MKYLTPKKGKNFYQGGDPPVSVRNSEEPSKWPDFFAYDPIVRLWKELRTKFPLRILRLTLYLLFQQVLFLCERRVNFLHFEN